MKFKDKIMLHGFREVKCWWEVGEVGRWERWKDNEVTRWERWKIRKFEKVSPLLYKGGGGGLNYVW